MQKVYIGKHSKFGKGVFAVRNIQKGEVVFTATGRIIHAIRASCLPKYPRDHAVQIGARTYVSSVRSIACNTNHSCSPNCGLKGRLRFVALKNIKKGEELTYDYSTSENSDWHLTCLCGSKNCRKIIGPWRELPSSVKRKYIKMGIVSSWILKNSSISRKSR